MISFRIVESPEPVRASGRKERRIIADVTDLFDSSVVLYASTRVLRGEYALVLVEENKNGFIDKKRWRVNMAHPMDRAGIRQFKSVPLDILEEYWRKPINIKEAELSLIGSGIVRFDDAEYFNSRKVTCYFEWPEMEPSSDNPIISAISTTSPAHQSHKTLSWLFEHSPEIIPFTDANTMFLDPETEVAYISDLMG